MVTTLSSFSGSQYRCRLRGSRCGNMEQRCPGSAINDLLYKSVFSPGQYNHTSSNYVEYCSGIPYCKLPWNTIVRLREQRAGGTHPTWVVMRNLFKSERPQIKVLTRSSVLIRALCCGSGLQWQKNWRLYLRFESWHEWKQTERTRWCFESLIVPHDDNAVSGDSRSSAVEGSNGTS